MKTIEKITITITITNLLQTKVASSCARRRKPRPLTISSPSHAPCLPSHVQVNKQNTPLPCPGKQNILYPRNRSHLPFQELPSLSPLQRDPTPPLTKMTTTSTPPSYTSPLLARYKLLFNHIVKNSNNTVVPSRLATMCLSHRPSPTLEQTQFTLSALSTPPGSSLLQTPASPRPASSTRTPPVPTLTPPPPPSCPSRMAEQRIGVKRGARKQSTHAVTVENITQQAATSRDTDRPTGRSTPTMPRSATCVAKCTFPCRRSPCTS